MTLEQLPPKGVKREQAILELGKDEANAELLFQLVNTEKGKYKTAAQKALAHLEYAPAAPLRAKLVKGKWMGSNVMSDACSDCVSEQIAPVILKTLSRLLDEGDTKPLEIEQLNFCLHLMLGKASPKMLEVYRFLAENTQRIAQLTRAPVYSDDDCTSWWITDGLRIWNATPKEKEKIPAVVLTASLIIIMAALYDYVDTTQREQLVDETHLAAKGVELNGKTYLHKLDSDNYRITWVAADGTVLFDTGADASRMENHLEREEIRQALQNGTGAARRYSPTLADRQLYAAQRLPDGTVRRLSVVQLALWSLVLGFAQPICLVALLARWLSFLLAVRPTPCALASARP